ncbi:MAG: 4-hydroxy-tetrahydrodipicolinate reductase [Pseudomonadales bacterium]|nr:4-hydroxy-tetrahydrodipicolinate reductase [Pseudomonadales bacterium]
MSDAPPLFLAIHGAVGRLGAAVLELALASPACSVVGATVSARSDLLDCPVEPEGAVSFGKALEPAAMPAGTVVLELSRVEALPAHAQQAAAQGWPLVVGVTGLDSASEAALTAAAKQIPVLRAPNFSLGVALLKRLAQVAAKALGPEFDGAILDVHHRHKLDAPSGTARALAEALQGAGRTVPIVSQRVGGVIGDHTLTFAGPGERFELRHQAEDRTLFARGALAAASFLQGQAPGTYTMDDVLTSRGGQATAL